MKNSSILESRIALEVEFTELQSAVETQLTEIRALRAGCAPGQPR